MLAHRQSAGALPSAIDLLKIIAMGTDRVSLITLRSLEDILSGPGADPAFRAPSFLQTYHFTGFHKKIITQIINVFR